MTIRRAARPTSHFTILPNHVLRDIQLSFKARGLLAYILSQPDHWSTSSTQLALVGPDGRDAVRTGLTELEAAGYLVRLKQQGPDGRWSTVTVVYDTPVTSPVDKLWRTRTTEAGLSDVGKPGANN